MGARLFLDAVKRGCRAEGDVIECGVGKGGADGAPCSLDFAEHIKNTKLDKKVYAVDCFQGLPWGEEDVPLHEGGCWTFGEKEYYAAVTDHGVFGIIVPCVGLFKDEFPKLADKKFCFAYIDADLYLSTLQAVKFLMPRMTKDSLMGFHDYINLETPGVKKVVDSLLKNNPDFEEIETDYPSTYIFFERK